jgi:hypothetical protein
MPRHAIVFLLVTAFIGQAAVARATAQATSFEFRESPLLDLHMYVRQQASEAARENELPGLDRACSAAQEVEKVLGDPLQWGLIEPMFAQCATAADLVKAISELPGALQLRDGRFIGLRAPALAYAQALSELEPQFLEKLWPAHLESIREGRQRLQKVFSGREADCISHLLQSLGMQDPGVSAAIYLVSHAPPPQAFTQRARGGSMCIIGVKEEDESLFAEMLVHELIHVLDLATSRQPTVLVGLRQSLADQGFDETSRAWRDVPHTLMFVQAAATVRAILDPQHEAYGDARGYYARVPSATRAVREPWEQCLAGTLSREEALERIMAEATKGGP